MMTVEQINNIVVRINEDISDISQLDRHLTYYYYFHNTDMLAFVRTVAEKLEAIEERFENNYILLKKNDIYIKFDWKTVPNEKLAITIEICSDLNCMEF
jgi:hypothetical protein